MLRKRPRHLRFGETPVQTLLPNIRYTEGGGRVGEGVEEGGEGGGVDGVRVGGRIRWRWDDGGYGGGVDDDLGFELGYGAGRG